MYERVAEVFADNGEGIRGDLAAVWKAIYTDPEVTNRSGNVNFGRVRDPFEQGCTLYKALEFRSYRVAVDGESDDRNDLFFDGELINLK